MGSLDKLVKNFITTSNIFKFRLEMGWLEDLNRLLQEFLYPSVGFYALTVERVLLSLIVTFILTMFIYYVYRKTFRGVIYTKNFNLTLVLVGLVVTLVTIPISSSVALSLGMIGALSMIRFRTAIKDPAEIAFTFWAIAVGIASGAALYMVAVVGSPIIGLFIFALSKARMHSSDPYLLVIHYSSDAEKAVQQALPKGKIRSRTVTRDGVELMLEVRMKEKETSEIDKLLKIEGVRDASLVSYSADTAP